MKIQKFHLAVAASFFCIFMISVLAEETQSKKTWAERLGWPAGSRVIILHVDDAGMSHESNSGAIEAIEKGIASSLSIMMPCPWVPEMATYAKNHAAIDLGIHLTLNAEWKNYRWTATAGKSVVPSLLDEEGFLWNAVMATVQKGTAQDVDREIRSQLEMAKKIGLQPTHLDSHMGTVMTPPFLESYIQLGIENHIPVMFPAGHMQYIGTRVGAQTEKVAELARRLWAADLPLIDDILTDPTTGNTYAEMKATLIQRITNMKPGICHMIVHCTALSENFKHISHSGEKRSAELRLMVDPEIKELVRSQGIVVSSWRELAERRHQIGKVAY